MADRIKQAGLGGGNYRERIQKKIEELQRTFALSRKTRSHQHWFIASEKAQQVVRVENSICPLRL